MISIITAVYNAEKFIAEAMKSVLAQTYSNWELIIINDGSTDNSRNEILKFADKRIRYFEQSNHGVSVARNVGLSEMRGDYFCFLDADDHLPKTSLESRFNVFKNSENIHFVDGKVDFYDRDLQQKIKSWTPNFEGNPLDDLLSLSDNSFFGLSWLIKRNKGISYTFKPGLSHGEDLLFYINLARKSGSQYAYTQQTVLTYRTGNRSAMKNIKGLENGYFEIYEEIKTMPEVSSKMGNRFLLKAKSIMLKTYLNELRLGHAIKVLLR